ncbi:GNAT family N-acetyltransferase [Paenibacillus sp. N1-5-1-14]|uniref:GNAT family N-acetyltransferase n=1 Tax=Paenibacillus radicibacter TaxID=2972488 RepID=UPI002158E109|nr:GNAT family protein [Paenibacillus radicibacter]MCR8641182.1 GNAT family N-acetyltransferase [Paenibacillus radicibacter]
MIRGNNFYLRNLQHEDAQAQLDLFVKNRLFFEPFLMTSGDEFYTLEHHQHRIEKQISNIKEDKAYSFGIFLNENDQLIGNLNLFQVIRGALQGAFIGYFLDKDVNGKGYTTEAVKLAVNYAFEELKLHRIEAGVMPHNLASLRVLEKSGFHKEGIAIKNVLINGKWEDHQVLAIINPND